MIYVIFTTIITFAIIGVVVVLIIMTYTTKLDNNKNEPALPEFANTSKFILYIMKDCLLVYLSWTLGFHYIAVLVCTQIMFSLFYKFIERDLTTKMVKLKLAWEDPKDRSFTI